MLIKQSALHFLYLIRYANAYKYKHPIYAFISLYVLKQELIIQSNTRTEVRVRIKITVGTYYRKNRAWWQSRWMLDKRIIDKQFERLEPNRNDTLILAMS